METLSHFYHDRASELLDQATHTPFGEVRQGLLRVAIAYEHLAEEAKQHDSSC
jgi:hypothetical protein